MLTPDFYFLSISTKAHYISLSQFKKFWYLFHMGKLTFCVHECTAMRICSCPIRVEKHVKRIVCLFCCFTSQVNSYGHGGTVSSHNHTFFPWASSNKQLTRGEFNNARARRALVDWYLSLFVLFKA